MNKFDFDSLLPYVIQAFTAVLGEEFNPIISQRVNNAIIIPYYDIEGLKSYISYLKHCKVHELSIRFLEEIGIDVQGYKKENYAAPLDENIKGILRYFICSAEEGFSINADYCSPLRAFNSNNKTDSRVLLQNKIIIINYLLGEEHESITEVNFDAFSETKEYSELLKKVHQFNMIYEKLLSEYDNWTSHLLPYEQYIEQEEKRKEDILQKKKHELFKEVFDRLPESVRDIIIHKTLEEQQDIILGGRDIASMSDIEYFQFEQLEKLKSTNVGLGTKFFIVNGQSNYLKKLGIKIPDEKMLKCDSEEDVMNYLNFLNQNHIRKYIPSEDLTHYISSVRKRKYEEALKEYHIARQDFIDVIRAFGNKPNSLGIIYNLIRNKRVGVLGGRNNAHNEYISIMFYTAREYEAGVLFYVFMHEMGHIIDQNEKGSGFELKTQFIDGKFQMNPYDKNLRKYEAFNETINDIFAIEAVEFLQKLGFYFIESKEFTLLDTSNRNTALITKNLLYPLIQKFRKQIIKAKVNVAPEELIKYIGEVNFENLVDAVNKVDYLSKNGVVTKIDKEPEDAMVMEYFEQVERVKQIYMNIDDYYAQNFGTLTCDDLSSKKK